MIEIANVALPLDLFADTGIDSVDVEGLCRAAAGAAGVNRAEVREVRILRRSIDARKRSNVHFVATLGVVLVDQAAEERACARPGVKPHVPYAPLKIAPWPDGAPRPVVVGMGPAGLFAAVYLARAGARPLVIERGACVEDRQRAVDIFESGGPLDLDTNIQFGEGGAGAFSDGKLTNNMKNPLSSHVLHWFVDAGAPDRILWEAHPHIGSDKLPTAVAALRAEIISRGGQVRFQTRVEGLEFSEGRLTGVVLRHPDSTTDRVSANQVVLATGHSARDTYAMLYNEGFTLERKPFAMGVRIEHDQQAVNRGQWGAAADHPALDAAEYKAAVHVPSGRTVYTFCMCPGGYVTCATSEPGGVVVNGMSNFARDGANANAALLVNVAPEDFGGDPDDPLAGVVLQQEVELRAFALAVQEGGVTYQAPAQRVGYFLGQQAVAESDAEFGRRELAEDSDGKPVMPTYARGVVWCDLHEVLPPFVSKALEQAFPLLERRIHGFSDPQAVMTAPETRSSSPVRVVRGKSDLQAHVGAPDAPASGVFPCGEGAGYAGGIMSAAVDGLRVAQALVAAAAEGQAGTGA